MIIIGTIHEAGTMSMIATETMSMIATETGTTITTMIMSASDTITSNTHDNFTKLWGRGRCFERAFEGLLYRQIFR
jgi:hypothetical protein